MSQEQLTDLLDISVPYSHIVYSSKNNNASMSRPFCRKPDTRSNSRIGKISSQTSLNVRYLSPSSQQITVMKQIGDLLKFHESRINQMKNRQKQIHQQASNKSVQQPVLPKTSITLMFSKALNVKVQGVVEKADLAPSCQKQAILTSNTLSSKKEISKTNEEPLSDITSLQQEVKKLKSENEFVKGELQKSQSLNRKQQTSIEKLTDKIKIMESDLREQVRQKLQFQASARSLQSKLLYFEVQLDSKHETLSKMGKKVDKSKLQSLKDKNSELEKQNRKVKQMLQKANSELRFLQKELQEVRKKKTQNTNLQMKCLKLSEKNRFLEGRVQKINDQKSRSPGIMSSRLYLKSNDSMVLNDNSILVGQTSLRQLSQKSNR